MFENLLKTVTIATFVSAPCLEAFAIPKWVDLKLKTDWAKTWDDCGDVNLPYFTKSKNRAAFMLMMRTGDQWEQDLNYEIQELHRVSTVSCRKWEAGNGSDRLREFLAELDRVASRAVFLQGKLRTSVVPQLENWSAAGDAELKAFGLTFDQLLCGKSLLKLARHLEVRSTELRGKVDEFGTTCVQSADPGIIAAVEGMRQKTAGKTGIGRGSPLNVTSKKIIGRKSEVTGEIEKSDFGSPGGRGLASVALVRVEAGSAKRPEGYAGDVARGDTASRPLRPSASLARGAGGLSARDQFFSTLLSGSVSQEWKAIPGHAIDSGSAPAQVSSSEPLPEGEKHAFFAEPGAPTVAGNDGVRFLGEINGGELAGIVSIHDSLWLERESLFHRIGRKYRECELRLFGRFPVD